MPRTRRPLLALAVASGLLAGCIQAPVRVVAETSEGADFSNVRTFAQVPPETDGPRVGPTVEKEIAEQLMERGLTRAPLESADIAVNFRAHGVRQQRIEDRGDPDASWKVDVSYIQGTLEIDVFQPETQKVLWRGIGHIDVYSDPAMDQASKKVVRKIMERFPIQK
jgi:hypothetical protein